MVRDVGDGSVKNRLNEERRQKLSEVIKADGLNLKTFLKTGWTHREQTAEVIPPCRSDWKPNQSPPKRRLKILESWTIAVSQIYETKRPVHQGTDDSLSATPSRLRGKSYKLPQIHWKKDSREFNRTGRDHKYGWSIFDRWPVSH